MNKMTVIEILWNPSWDPKKIWFYFCFTLIQIINCIIGSRNFFFKEGLSYNFWLSGVWGVQGLSLKFYIVNLISVNFPKCLREKGLWEPLLPPQQMIYYTCINSPARRSESSSSLEACFLPSTCWSSTADLPSSSKRLSRLASSDSSSSWSILLSSAWISSWSCIAYKSQQSS